MVNGISVCQGKGDHWVVWVGHWNGIMELSQEKVQSVSERKMDHVIVNVNGTSIYVLT